MIINIELEIMKNILKKTFKYVLLSSLSTFSLYASCPTIVLETQGELDQEQQSAQSILPRQVSDAITSELTLITETLESFKLSEHVSTNKADLDRDTGQSAINYETTLSDLPYDMCVQILLFVNEQKDLLRAGLISRQWRQAAIQIWKVMLL